MRWKHVLLMVFLLASSVLAAIMITNVTEWVVKGISPPVKKLAGTDLGNPMYGVKKALIYSREEDGLNVTYAEVIVPRCHKAAFDPVLIIAPQSPVPVKLQAVSLTGSYTSQLSLNVSISGVAQVKVSSGSIIQSTGTPITISSNAGVRLEVLVGSSAPLGVEVARLETWLHFNYSRAKVSQKIVWIFKTFSTPPSVVIFYDGFESGNLNLWSRTTYTHAEQKLSDVTVTERCYLSSALPSPQTITDTTRPVAGSWLAWIGFRNQVACEPVPARDDYLRRQQSIPASIDGVEVRYVNVTFWWRFLTWDSANYDYITLSLQKGSTTYYFKQGYNPNPGNNYGPFKDTGWQRNSTLFSGVAGSTVTLTFLLHTFSDEYYRSWLYIDEVYFVAYFDCVPFAADPVLNGFTAGVHPLEIVSSLDEAGFYSSRYSSRPGCENCEAGG